MHVQHQFSINEWAGDKLIGLYRMPYKLTAESYLQFLQNNLHDMLHDVLLETRCQMCFEHIMVPRHILDGM